ncbi:NAD(P)/FAD-dependent oxidoreductase [uncultured Aquimarina sp.]|uniref:NAD(P)/FAD-dependent oxidoreductase n=1 Tax=uncultured Aquimarina sp. TaxID=575652 RepID=UPI00262FBE49|nr:NAD(P)/FAD-dependent oxidoreductase [uncultured Aquimarina sp.]
MTKDNSYYKVVIVGGGPAGIATSLTLSSIGISNCIIEATIEPTKKCGEAIPPNAKPILKQLGIQHLIEHPRHIKYYGNKVCWGSEDLEQKEFIRGIHGYGYLLDRLYFEKQLRKQVKKNGTAFYEGYKLNTVSRGKSSIEAVISNTQNEITINGSYIVDGTGRKASVCRKLGIYKTAIDSQFAITFSVKTLSIIANEIIVETTENGWWYVAPEGNNQYTLMFFTTKDLIPKKKELEMFLEKELLHLKHISKILNPMTCNFEKIRIMPAGTSCLDIPYGDRWIAVGDAAYAYDPVSSYGITSALASGFYAGKALASYFLGKEDAMLVYRYILENAFQSYMEKLTKYYSTETKWKESMYWKYRFFDLYDKTI